MLRLSRAHRTTQRSLDLRDDYVLVSGMLCLAVVVILTLFDDVYFHWSSAALAVAGILPLADLIRVIHGRRSPLEPEPLVGLVAFHLCFLAPILHIGWDEWLPYTVGPPDWRPWIGLWSLGNFVGYALYCSLRTPRRQSHTRKGAEWRVSLRKFRTAMIGGCLLSIGAFLLLVESFGGYTAYLRALTSRNTADLAGTGVLVVTAEALPLLLLLWWIVEHRFGRRRNWITRLPAWLFLAVAGVVLVVMGGARGSRAALLWPAVIAAIYIHKYIRPIGRGALLGLLAIFVFAQIYGAYKVIGSDAARAFGESAAFTNVTEATGRTEQYVLLRDLARADIQALLMYRLQDDAWDFQPAMGRTYLGGVAAVIPSSLWPNRPPTKALEGTAIQYGPGASAPGGGMSTRQYGIVGEGMLNFGFLGIPMAWVLLGALIRFVHAFGRRLHASDSRLLLVPALVALPAAMLLYDSDNVILYLIKYVMIPGIVVVTASRAGRPA